MVPEPRPEGWDRADQEDMDETETLQLRHPRVLRRALWVAGGDMVPAVVHRRFGQVAFLVDGHTWSGSRW